jgi:hypothetical protein
MLVPSFYPQIHASNTTRSCLKFNKTTIKDKPAVLKKILFADTIEQTSFITKYKLYIKLYKQKAPNKV